MSPSQSEHNLSFRKASVQDAPAIAELVNSAYRGDSSRQGWTTEADLISGQRTDCLAIEDIILSPHQWILVGEDKASSNPIESGRLVVTALLEKVKPEVCYFGMFAVSPSLQAKGVGKIFIEAAEKFAREELGSQWMEMTVISLRTELMAWYERRGYEKMNEFRPFPYGDERNGTPLRSDITLQVFLKRL